MVVVEKVWRYPVKSIGGERLETVSVDKDGVLGDRVWAVQDGDGRLGSGKNSRRFTRILGLLGLTSRYDDPAEPPIVIGPDTSEYPVATGAADAFLSELSRREVHVRRDTGVMHFDEVPLSLVGTATLDWLADQLPHIAIDERRLRPNFVVRTDQPFAEEQWIGRVLRIGSAEAVFDRVFMRCVMVGMEQPGLPDSSDVLKRVGQREDNPVCLAVGGEIVTAGQVSLGDAVR